MVLLLPFRVKYASVCTAHRVVIGIAGFTAVSVLCRGGIHSFVNWWIRKIGEKMGCKIVGITVECTKPSCPVGYLLVHRTMPVRHSIIECTFLFIFSFQFQCGFAISLPLVLFISISLSLKAIVHAAAWLAGWRCRLPQRLIVADVAVVVFCTAVVGCSLCLNYIA